jgi:hypothetical protein
VQDTPADRPEQPFGEEQRTADDEEDARQQDDRDRDADIGRDPGDLAADGLDLGSGQLDVGQDEAEHRIAGRPDLGTEAPWPVIGRDGSLGVQGSCSVADLGGPPVGTGAGPR